MKLTQEEYFEYMQKPLSEAEKQTLIDAGWSFVNDTYIEKSNDYDGCMADGIINIRRILLHLQDPARFIRHHGNTSYILDEMLHGVRRE